VAGLRAIGEVTGDEYSMFTLNEMVSHLISISWALGSGDQGAVRWAEPVSKPIPIKNNMHTRRIRRIDSPVHHLVVKEPELPGLHVEAVVPGLQYIAVAAAEHQVVAVSFL
jgi:hypothetical protein